MVRSCYDSNLSLDSLECENTISKSKSAHKNVTIVPYYSGEVFLEDIEHLKHHDNSPHKCLNSKIPTNLSKFPYKSHSACMNLGSDLKPNGSFSLMPSFTYFADEKPSRAINLRRISRRTILPEEQTIRPRHKSVSYVEQFRKKIFPSRKLQESTLSIADSQVYQRPSFESWENRDIDLGTSEFEFSNDIMFQPQSTQIDLSLSQLNNESEKSASGNLTKPPRKNKEKTVTILKRVDISGNEKPGNKVVEKKSSVERREEYATKVKLKNQLNFNRQKDRERINKIITRTDTSADLGLFHTPKPPYMKVSPQLPTPPPLPLSLKEKSSVDLFCKNETEVNENTPNISAIPFTCPLDILGSTSDSPKTKKHARGKSVKQMKKAQFQDDITLEMLRKRHEQERKLVNSLRQIILKH